MLYFHIADRCRGFGILDDMMRQYRNVYFYTLDIKEESPLGMSQLYCLPTSLISTCIRDIIEHQCGKMAAGLVQNYLLYLQDRYSRVLQSVGLNSDICDHDRSSDQAPSSRLLIHSVHRNVGLSRLLAMTSPGTALDTVYGKSMMTHLNGLSGEELCTTAKSDVAYGACLMSSDDPSEKNKFNILQFAHLIVPFLYHGTQCSRLEEFTACWDMLHNTCGHRVRGLERHATLFVEGCKIQSKLETVGCHWQDMLLAHYINASRVTVWPVTAQCLINPMNLESTHYHSFYGILDDMDIVTTLLQPGVKEISRKCDPTSANRLITLLNKLHYLQRDALMHTKVAPH